jgi:hypothetical protein
LEERIRTLEQHLVDEKAYAFDLFLKEEAQKSCAKALLRYSLVADAAPIEEEDENRSAMTETNSTGGGNYRELYQDLVQQFECEKKLNNSMVDALENKVSELIAENDTLKVSNIKLKK